MTGSTNDHTTASHPTGITPSTATTTSTATVPTKTTPLAPAPGPTAQPTTTAAPGTTAFLQPTPIPAPGMRGGIFPRPGNDDVEIGRLSPTPPMPQPGAVPFLPRETGTGPSSRASSVNPNDTLPPTPNPEQPQPYPPQMRMPMLLARDIPKSTMPLPPGEHRMHGEQEVRPTTHLPLDDRSGGRTATTSVEGVLLPTPTDYHNALPSQPVQEASYTAAKRGGDVHPSGYKQDSEAMEKPRYYGNEGSGGSEVHGGETLLGKLGKWVEGINSKVAETGITGNAKEEEKGKGME